MASDTAIVPGRIVGSGPVGELRAGAPGSLVAAGEGVASSYRASLVPVGFATDVRGTCVCLGTSSSEPQAARSATRNANANGSREIGGVPLEAAGLGAHP